MSSERKFLPSSLTNSFTLFNYIRFLENFSKFLKRHFQLISIESFKYNPNAQLLYQCVELLCQTNKESWKENCSVCSFFFPQYKPYHSGITVLTCSTIGISAGPKHCFAHAVGEYSFLTLKNQPRKALCVSVCLSLFLLLQNGKIPESIVSPSNTFIAKPQQTCTRAVIMRSFCKTSLNCPS